MSTFKHTPGPWATGEVYRDHWLEIVGNGGKRMVCGVMRVIRHKFDRDSRTIAKVPNDEGWSNARLIAAAPELLEALQLLLDAEYSDLVTIDDLGRAEAAIAKATQEPQE
jgi:hypothetical protein